MQEREHFRARFARNMQVHVSYMCIACKGKGCFHARILLAHHFSLGSVLKQIDNMHAILFERKMINYSSAATLSKKVDGERLPKFCENPIHKYG